MARSGGTRQHEIRCAGCGHDVASYDIIHSGSLEAGYRDLCTQCFNEEVANACGLDGFAHATLEPIDLADCAGTMHEFHFRTRLFGNRVAIDAFELRDGEPAGYQFQIIGNAADDLLGLFTRLIAKMRRSLSTKHLTDGTLGLQIADPHVVRGRTEWDEAHEGRLPLLVIDGRPIPWSELGRMLMSYEGWQFKLSIHDKSDEV